MATAAALIFPDQTTAGHALEALRAVENSGDAKFLESGLLIKNPDGRVEMKKDGWKSEIMVGGAAGGAIGALLLGLPVIGVAGGALAGRYIGKHKESEETFQAFADQVKREMPPGGAAVLALVEATNPGRVHAALGAFGGTLFSTDLPAAEIANIQTELDKHQH
ncbi:MAG: DUF1269 domain-containing protein [Thermomicrobiales bacterium]